MAYSNKDLAGLIQQLDLGSSIAELDNLLETARIETSVFGDLASDKVDLVPGTKGSGKSALFRIFVEFLPAFFLKQQKVVIAHGVNRAGDSVFHAFKSEFEKLSEDDFQDFWCIYVISLVHEQFLKNPLYAKSLVDCKGEIAQFKEACFQARIPEIKAKKSLKDVLAWGLNALKAMKPSLKYNPPGDVGEVELTLFGDSQKSAVPKLEKQGVDLPRYMGKIKDSLEKILQKSDLSVWLMIDKLDEIFPRRSALERTALRALLRTMRVFDSKLIRLKIFLRDDMLNEVVRGGEGFVALTHVTARKADTLRWSEDQILAMIVARIYSNDLIRSFLGVNMENLNASVEYKSQAFYKVFPPTVHRGTRQSPTIRWIYNHTADGNGVVTPRDAIDLLTSAKQHQYDLLASNPSGTSESIIGSQSIQYGLGELSKHKRSTYLEAEFPHLWPYMNKFCGQKAEYAEKAMRRILGSDWKEIVLNLRSIGFLSETSTKGQRVYSIPYVYRKGLELTQGKVEK